MQSEKIKVDQQVNPKGEEKANRSFWCSRGEHWNKSDWKRIEKIWTRIKDKGQREELLQSCHRKLKGTKNKVIMKINKKGMLSKWKKIRDGIDHIYQQKKT